MNRPLPWFWILLVGLLLLAPGASLRVVLDLLGGLTALLVVLGLAGAAAAFVGVQFLRQRLRTCPACGTITISTGDCPACGAPPVTDTDGSLDARDTTITVTATEVEESSP